MKRVFWSLMLACCGLGYAHGQTYAANSVLSQGQWYKIGVRQTGMVKLDHSFLSSMGLDPNSIDPRNLQLYGNGGAILPQSNAAFRHDDLVQNPIQVAGQGDGRFDNGDYIAFFAEGPHTWRYDEESQAFRHQYHFYSDTNYYFLHVGNEPGLRVSEGPVAGASTFEAESLRNYQFYEREIENPINTGRVWLGERMDLTNRRNFRFYVPDMKADGQIDLAVRVAARSDRPTFFTLSAGGQVVANTSIDVVNLISTESTYYQVGLLQASVPASRINGNDSLVLTLEFNANGSSRSEGWLDWIEVSYDQAPDVANRSQWMGTLEAGTGAGAIARLRLQGANSSYQVWDVTNPVQAQAIPKTVSGNTLELTLAADSIKRLVAFRDASLRPVSGRQIPNQNLHSLDLVDYLVIAPNQFRAQAERLASFHRNHYGRSAAVVGLDQIYNEFGSGKQDVSAIRDFIRMLYVRSLGMAPGFVCLFGDGTYIYKDISEARNNNTNFVPTYQSRNSRHQVNSFTSDDFFVILEEDEGYWGEGSGYESDASIEINTIDAAVGRLPIEDITQAQQIVDKIIRYATEPNYGNWRNKVVLIADHRDNDGNTHVRQADGYTSLIEGQAPCMTLEKIYMDNYRMVVTAGNEAFPEGRDALLRSMNRGSLILNYTGHGSENAWSYARIFNNSDIANLENQGRTPAIITATCEFGRYDNSDKRSGGELLLMRPEGGAIAMFTTVRLVFAGANKALNERLYQHVFDFDSLQGRNLAVGEIMRRAKNQCYSEGNDMLNRNSRNFTLMGDPGLILNYPAKHARITEINERPVDPSRPDSLQSLGLVSVEGVVEDEFGAPMPDFSGEMDVTVFDKPSTYTTKRAPFIFDWQNNRIFNGRALINEGAFRFEFVVPIDISYEDGKGKISTYFYNQTLDGAGCYENLYVGGTDAEALVDNKGPEVELFINDTLWREGSVTSPTPDLYAIVSDENGINTTGTGIGHEISAMLDNDDEQVFILNDYYIADPGNYRRGQVRYPIDSLPAGTHTLRIRVWDVANNPSEDETTFIVADNAKLALAEVLNYPNPFNPEEGATTFRINHNLDGQPVRIEVDIFSREGRIVSQLRQEITPSGNLTQSLSWDGTTSGGAPIASGVYLYRVRLINLNNGQEAFETRRMVVIR
jgi:hypothetical protein